MNHFKEVVSAVRSKILKRTFLLFFIVSIIAFAMRYIVFISFNNNVKNDIENNKQTFYIPPEYINLNYKGTNENLNKDYLDAFEIYKKVMRDPKNKLEEAISYNLVYLDDLSDSRKNMIEDLENNKKQFTIDSFIKEKEKYNLKISKEDKEKLNNNSNYIKEQAKDIKNVDDRKVLLSSLNTLENILNLEDKDEALLLTKVYNKTDLNYLSFYFIEFMKRFIMTSMIITLLLVL